MIGDAFRERYHLTRFPSSGVVIDLLTGNYFRLNASATTICEALSKCATREEAVATVAHELTLEPSKAEDAIGAVVQELDVAAIRGVPQGSYLFIPSPNGYSLWHEDRHVLEVDGENLAIRVPAGQPPSSDRSLALYVRAVAPKLLFLRGVDVLHAATVRVHEKLIAFAGESGAGKTTTARAFAGAGAQLVSEDLMVFHPEREQGVRVVLTGEALAHAWVDKTVQLLRADASQVASSEELMKAASGETMPLDALLFLSVNRRSGTSLKITRLFEADAMREVMYNNILASPAPPAWRRFSKLGGTLATSTELFEATTPATTALLELAARAYMSTWTS